MVISCVAYGCKNIQFAGNGIQFHSFPFKRPEVLKLWMEAIKRENWKPSKTSRICSQLFKDTNYQERPWASVKLLKSDAVPSIFLIPALTPKEDDCKQRIIYHIPATELIPMEVKTEATASEYIDRATSPIPHHTNKSSREILLKKKIKILHQKIRRRNVKISLMSELIKVLKEQSKSKFRIYNKKLFRFSIKMSNLLA